MEGTRFVPKLESLRQYMLVRHNAVEMLVGSRETIDYSMTIKMSPMSVA